jgi:hypothetical protein
LQDQLDAAESRLKRICREAHVLARAASVQLPSLLETSDANRCEVGLQGCCWRHPIDPAFPTPLNFVAGRNSNFLAVAARDPER